MTDNNVIMNLINAFLGANNMPQAYTVPQRTVVDQLTTLLSFAKDKIQTAANYTVFTGLKAVQKGLQLFPQAAEQLSDPDLLRAAKDFENEVVLLARYNVVEPKTNSISSTIGHVMFQPYFEKEINAHKQLAQKIDHTAKEAANFALSIDLVWFAISRVISLNAQLQLVLLAGSWLCYAPSLASQPKLTQMIENDFAMTRDRPEIFSGIAGAVTGYSYEDIYQQRDGAMPAAEFSKRRLIL